MPIYEYQALMPEFSCNKCCHKFEIFQKINEQELRACIHCGAKVKKVISCTYSKVIKPNEEQGNVENKLKYYEKAGMWSHAAELADKCSEKTKDKTLKERALESYKKAGYS